MKVVANATLRQKLLRVTLGVLSLVAITTLSLLAWFNFQNEAVRLRETERQVRQAIQDRAEVLVENHALALSGLVAENSFTEVEKIVTRAVEGDDQIVYGLFVAADGKPWVYVAPTTIAARKRGVSDTLSHWQELALKPGIWQNPSATRGRRVLFGEELWEVTQPVLDGTEVLGVIRYGFSTAPLRKALTTVRSHSRETLRSTLLAMALCVLGCAAVGLVLVGRASSRIVRPLQTLREASERIASGEHGVRVQIASRDELQSLAGAFNQMQQANEEAMEHLRSALLQAQEASRLKSEFLANMSHEIRTPMNGVVGMTRLMLEMPLEGKLRRYVQAIDSSASALMTIINDVLDFSKMEAGKQTLQPASFDPAAQLQEVAELMSGRALGRGLELVCRASRHLPRRVVGDPDRYRQILLNLVSNAIKFTERGEVVVDVSLEASDDQGHVLRTIVRDTGIGIAKQDLDKLFDAFSQVDGSSVRRFGGTGLGLAICKHLAEMMGGRIGVVSEPGIGSTFSFTVRVGRAAISSAPADATFPTGMRVVVVEPNDHWRGLLEEHLVAWGLQCRAFVDGDAAMIHLQQSSDAPPCNVVIFAAHTQGVDVSWFVQQLRSLPVTTPIPVVLLLPLGSGPDLTHLEKEIKGQLLMPLRMSELYNLLAEMLLGSEKRISVACRAATSDQDSRYRFLVVDDNEINRFLAVEQLEGLGYQVDVAADGQEAVEKVKTCDYAAVLMDCQMPVMDGYTATRVIRDWEGDRRHTPIIALTAHALVGERDKVLAAGMDDYLAKPVRTQTMERVLQQAIESTRVLRAAATDTSSIADKPGTAPAPAVVGADAPADAVPSSLLDPKVDRSPRLMELFIERVPETLRELDAAVQAQHADDIRSRAHKLKGSCLALGAETMANDAQALELQSKAGVISDAAARAERLRAQYVEVAAALRAELAAVSGKACSDPPHRVSA